MGRFFTNREYEAQFGRTLSAARAESADLGEAVATAERIVATGEDDAAWHREWSAAAETATADAARSLAAGNRVGARRAHLRAAEYHRQAFYLLRDDVSRPALHAGYTAHRAAFQAALPLLDGEAAAVAIPYEGTTLNGYLFRPDRTDERRPTIIAPAGYDSTAEAGWVDEAAAALAHGCNCLTFEGPGQGGVLYEQGLVFRHDFEAVLTPVIDWLDQQPGVDPSRHAVVGRSFAGYLAPRALTVEHRPVALVCDPVQLDFSDRLKAQFGDGWSRVVDGDPTLEEELGFLLDDPARGQFFRLRMATHGVTKITDYFRELARFSLRDGVADIATSTLACSAEGDPADDGQLDEFVGLLTCPVQVRRFTAAEGSGGHCEGLGQDRFDQAVYDFLTPILGLTGS
ncbi:MAG: alpha/beta hydrolase family protein [Aquihabitans sp.]